MNKALRSVPTFSSSVPRFSSSVPRFSSSVPRFSSSVPRISSSVPPVFLAAALALVGVGAPSPALADMVGVTCTVAAAGQAQLEALRAPDHNRLCTGFIARNAAGKVVQKVENGFKGSGSYVVSDDARTVIFVGSYSNVVQGSSHMGWFLTKEERAAGKVGVVLFRDGMKVGEYLLADLVGQRERITRSVSHFGWTNWRCLQKQPEKTWTLETEAGVRITFDTVTGDIIHGSSAKKR